MSAPAAEVKELEVAAAPLPRLIAALAAAQGEFPTIEKTQTATVPGKDGRSGYSYTYADLGDVLAKVRPVLSKHGLALVQRTTTREGGKVQLLTELHHTAGGMIDSDVELGQSSSNPQQFGGALTYLRRYEAVTLLGIAAEEDRDAQDVDPPPRGAPAQLPPWATSLNQERNKEVLDQLEVLIGRDAGRQLMIDIKNTADGVPAILLPTVKAIVTAYLADDSEAVGTRRSAAQQPSPPATGDEVTPVPESDVPPDSDGLDKTPSLEPEDDGLFAADGDGDAA